MTKKLNMCIMLLVSFVINFISYWNSDKIALASYRAQPISPEQAPELHKLVKQLADNAGIAMPRLYLIPTDVPNAFATGRDDKHAAVAVTEGLLRILNRDEVAGVISHELSHIKHWRVLCRNLTIMHIIAFCQVLSRKPKGCSSLTRSAEKAAFRICFQRILLRKSVLKSCAKLQQI